MRAGLTCHFHSDQFKAVEPSEDDAADMVDSAQKGSRGRRGSYFWCSGGYGGYRGYTREHIGWQNMIPSLGTRSNSAFSDTPRLCLRISGPLKL